MEIEVEEAMRTLSQGNTQMNPHQVLGLQDRLRIVDEKFAQLRREITRLNTLVAVEKDKNDALRARCQLLVEENEMAKEQVTSSQSTKSTPKKKTKKRTSRKK